MIIKTTGKPVHIMNLLSVLRCLSYALAVITTICYFYQIVYLILPLIKKQRPLQTRERRRYAILIAARNEEAVLPHLLESIRLQDYPAELITTYVVADNCTDRTAVVAEQGGAQVFRRFSATEIGKGYALNYLLKKIDETAGLDSYDAFLIFDADNLLLPDYVTATAKISEPTGYPRATPYGISTIPAI